MARKAAIDPTDDTGLISPMTEPAGKGDGGVDLQNLEADGIDQVAAAGLISPNYQPEDDAGSPRTEPGGDVRSGESVPIPGKWAPEETTNDDASLDTGGPQLRDGHDQIIEQAPGIGAAAETLPPMGDPGDLSSFGSSAAGLPDDLGLGDKGFGGPVDAGGDLGSTLLEDLAGDLSDPTDGLDGIGDASGQPVFDDPTGRAMDGGDDILAGTPSGDFYAANPRLTAEAMQEYAVGNTVMGDFLIEAATAASEAGDERHDEEVDLQSGSGSGSGSGTEDDPIVIPSGDPITPSDDDEDDDDEERQGSGGDDGTSGTQSTPIPPEVDDGTGGSEGGELDPSLGGDVDPAIETEDHGGGDLIGGRGDIDFDPELDEAGGGAIDPARAQLGFGAIDPLDGESTLLSGDTGDLAEMTAEADLGSDVEVEFDDSLADADIGEDA